MARTYDLSYPVGGGAFALSRKGRYNCRMLTATLPTTRRLAKKKRKAPLASAIGPNAVYVWNGDTTPMDAYTTPDEMTDAARAAGAARPNRPTRHCRCNRYSCLPCREDRDARRALRLLAMYRAMLNDATLPTPRLERFAAWKLGHAVSRETIDALEIMLVSLVRQNLTSAAWHYAAAERDDAGYAENPMIAALADIIGLGEASYRINGRGDYVIDDVIPQPQRQGAFLCEDRNFRYA